MAFNEHHIRFPFSTNVGYIHQLDASLRKGLCTVSRYSVSYGNDLTRLYDVRDYSHSIYSIALPLAVMITEVNLYSFLCIELDGSEWSASSS